MKHILAGLLIAVWLPFAALTAVLLIIDAAFGAALSKLR